MCSAKSIYESDLAYIHATAYGGLARGAAPDIMRRLRSATIPIRHVVDAGCGAGALTETLAAAGFEVTGIDASAELLSIAREAVPAARFVHASLYDVEIPACGAVVALGEPLTYHWDDSDAGRRIEAFFHRVAQTLPAGGLLLFDLIERGEPSLAGRMWSAGDDWAVLVETTEDHAKQTLRRDIQTFRRTGDLYRRGREIHRVRLFDTPTVCGWLAACGFEVETASSYGTQALAPRRRAFFATLTHRAAEH